MDSEPRTDPARHHDAGGWLARFAGRMLVVCPRCEGRALVIPRPDLCAPEHLASPFHARRLACGGCGAVADWNPGGRARLVGTVLGGSEDPYFRRPLWLQTRCAGHILWAYNEDHVDELSAYVGARLRERGGVRPTMAMFARLPVWMKRSDRRTEVLAGLDTLRELAKRTAPADRSDAAYGRGDRSRAHRRLYVRGGPHD
ncbi:hypothetical protein DEJ51_01400 [Streptomyces venezuelae]|uniref:TFIIB-type zinc ribbon-containing protein n=1 Tax=Streptomyces venezuelae TaxID=54571 RepID=A0A5P2DTV8_STRVZ|nr:hypothetical protein [Streptomyces venezuelae]QES58624.1 hypothetical protein DEJ51_01400 [Streptomyces venezuelae]